MVRFNRKRKRGTKSQRGRRVYGRRRSYRPTRRMGYSLGRSSGGGRFRRKLRRAVMRVPTTQLVRLPVSMSVTLADDQTVMFQLNSLYSPMVAGTPLSSGNAALTTTSVAGHKPRGFDQWAAMYRTYCVLGAKVKIELLRCADGTAGAELVSFIDDDKTCDNLTPGELFETGFPHQRTVIDTVSTGTGAGSRLGAKVRNQYHSFSQKAFWKLPKNRLIYRRPAVPTEADDLILTTQFQAEVDKNPVKAALLKIQNSRGASSSASTTMYLRVNIVYLALMTNPKELPVS